MKFIGISGYPLSCAEVASYSLVSYLRKEGFAAKIGSIKNYTKGIFPVNDDNLYIICPDVYDYKDAEFLTKYEDDLLICVNNDKQVFHGEEELIESIRAFPDIVKIRSLACAHDGSYITNETNGPNESSIGNLSAALIHAVRNKYLVDHA